MKIPDQVFVRLTEMAGTVNSVDRCREFCESILGVIKNYSITRGVAKRLVKILESVDVGTADKEEMETAIALVRERVLNAAGFTAIRKIWVNVRYEMTPAKVRAILDPVFNPHGLGTLRKVRG